MDASRKLILIPDTSWLMEIGKQNRNYLLEFVKQEPENRIIKIHNRVFKELDALKKAEDKSSQSRMASQFIEEVVKKYPKNIEIDNFGINRPSDNFKNALTSEVDAIVLTLAQKSKDEGDVVLATTDRNQRILAEKNNIQTMKDEPTNDLVINKNEKANFDFDEVVYSSSPIIKYFLVILLSGIWILFLITSILHRNLITLCFLTGILIFTGFIWFLKIIAKEFDFSKKTQQKNYAQKNIKKRKNKDIAMWDFIHGFGNYTCIGGTPARDYLYDDED